MFSVSPISINILTMLPSKEMLAYPCDNACRYIREIWKNKFCVGTEYLEFPVWGFEIKDYTEYNALAQQQDKYNSIRFMKIEHLTELGDNIIRLMGSMELYYISAERSQLIYIANILPRLKKLIVYNDRRAIENRNFIYRTTIGGLRVFLFSATQNFDEISLYNYIEGAIRRIGALEN